MEGRKIQDGDHVPKHAPIGYCDSKLMNAVFARELASKHGVLKTTINYYSLKKIFKMHLFLGIGSHLRRPWMVQDRISQKREHVVA